MNWKVGELVEIKKPCEIIKTLDSNLMLNGVQFMPEMLEYCGKIFVVHKIVNKVCCEKPSMIMRTFPKKDVLILKDLRCSGLYHNECQIACVLFWKDSWLKKPSINKKTIEEINEEDLNCIKETKQKSKTNSCQSTNLYNATKPIKNYEKLFIIYRNLKSGNYNFKDSVKKMILPTKNKLRKLLFGEFPVGTKEKTPTESLSLQVGDIVEVKSLQEIIETLDKNGKNRGLHFSLDMAEHCGKQFRVRSRLDRMILEWSGDLRQLKNTVILENVYCNCPYTFGGCQRLAYQYFREIWLRKIISDSFGQQ